MRTPLLPPLNVHLTWGGNRGGGKGKRRRKEIGSLVESSPFKKESSRKLGKHFTAKYYLLSKGFLKRAFLSQYSKCFFLTVDSNYHLLLFSSSVKFIHSIFSPSPSCVCVCVHALSHIREGGANSAGVGIQVFPR